MKLLMTLVVRNEADILAANLDYHLSQGVDEFLVIDHGSEDGTPDILREYEQRNRLVWQRDDGLGHHQSRRVTRLADEARRRGATWIIHNDADEFWVPVAGTLRELFSLIPEPFGVVMAERYNFPPRPQNEHPFHRRLRWRETQSHGFIGQPLEPKVAHRPHPDVKVAPGNHSVEGAQGGEVPLAGIVRVHHYPMRSRAQFQAKVQQTGAGYEAVEDRAPGTGRDQLLLLDLSRRGELEHYYENRVLSDEALERGLAEGTLVFDDWVDAVLEKRQSSPPATPVLNVIGTALRRLADDKHALDDASRAEVELRTQLEASSARITRAEQELLATRDELSETRRALGLLRHSRLFRGTAPARRLFYRLRKD